MAKASSRDKVLHAALELFNARGSADASTNAIAEAAGISPGNLYYHFRNKQEIIRALYECAIADYDVFLKEAALIMPDPATTLGLFEGIFQHQWKYRFLQREFPALIRADELLRDRYREMQDRRIAFYRYLTGQWMEHGYVRTMTNEELDDLVTAIWLLGDTWLSYLESMGRSDSQEEVRRGARLMYRCVRPYLTEKSTPGFAAQGWE